MEAPPSRNKPGRPRLDPADESVSVSVHFRVSARHYDALTQQARAARLELADYLRKRLHVDDRRDRDERPT